MIYLALTQGTAEWMLPKVGLMDTINKTMQLLYHPESDLETKIFSEGPIRILMNPERTVIALWHVDYFSGTEDEAWGFIRISGVLSLEAQPVISREVLERSIYVVNQRLQGLLIDGALFHRNYDNNTHTLLSGRGAIARHYSIGYCEKAVVDHDSEYRGVICVGPCENFSVLVSAVDLAGKDLNRLIVTANKLLSTVQNRAPISANLYKELRIKLAGFAAKTEGSEFDNIEVTTGKEAVCDTDAMRCIGLSYAQWLDTDYPLNDAQRRILMSESIDRHPLRILGPGGSGKTLLMQLLVLRKMELANTKGQLCRVLYIVHSNAMRDKVLQRFQILTQGEISTQGRWKESEVLVTTLSEYCRSELSLDINSVLDTDADDAKEFQCNQVYESLNAMASENARAVSSSGILSQIFKNPDLVRLFAKLVVAEISVAVKGHGLEADKKKYVESERSLSRLHGILNYSERDFIFEVFKKYHDVIFEQYGVLDPDDIALSLSGRLNTPLWKLRRREAAFDYVFVDEAQLFNENERRVLPYLTRGTLSHVPIALALDQAQSFYGQSTAGLATIGIKDVSNEKLDSIHRSTNAIIKLAFFIIQRSTDLFGPEFPDFTKIARSLLPDNHEMASKPSMEKEGNLSSSYGKFVLKRVRDLRKENIRQIAVVCHAGQYWNELERELSESDLPFQVLRERGERLQHDQPLVVLCRPPQIGGQEFDAVIIVGLEFGVTPPRDINNEALNAAVEQQVIREMYLSVTRARYRVVFTLSKNASPNLLLNSACQDGLVAKK
jgi:superfamily I DNA/RNA helicase